MHGVDEAQTGSPREILQAGYKTGFIDDEAVWLTMLKKRNTAAYIYDKTEIEKMLLLISDSFIPAFVTLEGVMIRKTENIE